jgi:Zn-dependent peptidase ImmA (M78 family)
VRGLGYKVDFFEVTPETEHISGAVYYEENKIWLNPEDIKRRRNFTLAHELGHILLGHEKDVIDGREYDTRRNITKPDKKDKREIDANEFAAELLMPENAFKKVWDDTKSIVKLSDYFDVSIAATMARREKLGLMYDYEKK